VCDGCVCGWKEVWLHCVCSLPYITDHLILETIEIKAEGQGGCRSSECGCVCDGCVCGWK